MSNKRITPLSRKSWAASAVLPPFKPSITHDPLLNLYFPCMKQVRCERIGAKKKRKYDEAKTPLLRLLACSFEDKLEETRVKHDALALKDECALVEQKGLMDKAVDCLLSTAQDIPVIPHSGGKPNS